jgi:hypothetical protein
MAIEHQIRRKYATRNEEIVAGLIEATGAVPPLDPEIVIKRKAAEISTAMALLHGGDWHVEIDHHLGFVLISPRSGHQAP